MGEDAYYIAAFLGAATACIALVLSVFGGPLVPWDEQIYAGAAQSVLDGHALVPHFQIATHGFEVGPFLEKPPLAVWMQALSMALFGETPVAARIPSALAAGGVVTLAVLLGARWFGTLVGAFAGGILLVTDAMRETHAMQHAVTDMQLLFWGLLAVYAADRIRDANRPHRWGIVTGGALGAAILTKGIAGVPFVVLVLPLAIQDWRQYLHILPAVSLSLLVVAVPWHVLAYLAYPAEFVDEYIIEQLIERSKALHGHPVPGGLIPGSNFPYFKRMPGYFDVAFVGALTGIVADGHKATSGWRPTFQVLYCWGWAVLFPLGYAIAGGDNIWYMLPSAIPLALLAGRIVAPAVDITVTWAALATQ